MLKKLNQVFQTNKELSDKRIKIASQDYMDLQRILVFYFGIIFSQQYSLYTSGQWLPNVWRREDTCYLVL